MFYCLTVKFSFMEKISMKKLSVLGLILMTASAVTAAILPSKNSRFADSGTLRTGLAVTDDGAAVKTCITNADGGNPSCTKTIGSSAVSTAGASGGQSLVSGGQTVGNTSQTAGVSGDQNSVVE